ncbi:acyl-CoA thioesterase, partial [Vibrio cholerae]
TGEKALLPPTVLEAIHTLQGESVSINNA